MDEFREYVFLWCSCSYLPLIYKPLNSNSEVSCAHRFVHVRLLFNFLGTPRMIHTTQLLLSFSTSGISVQYVPSLLVRYSERVGVRNSGGGVGLTQSYSWRCFDIFWENRQISSGFHKCRAVLYLLSCSRSPFWPQNTILLAGGQFAPFGANGLLTKL